MESTESGDDSRPSCHEGRNRAFALAAFPCVIRLVVSCGLRNVNVFAIAIASNVDMGENKNALFSSRFTCPEETWDVSACFRIVLFYRDDREEARMDFKDLSEEQRAKVAGARTPEDMLRIAQEEGYELSDEELEQVAGGIFGWGVGICPKCGGTLKTTIQRCFVCPKCGYTR